MIIYIHHTKLNPQVAIEIDHTDWPLVEKRSVPVPGQLGGLDNTKGWIHSVNIQGHVFSADHYCITDIGGGAIRCITWHDDPDDYPNYDYFGQQFFGVGQNQRRQVFPAELV